MKQIKTIFAILIFTLITSGDALSRTVSVLDEEFGAIGDGVSDDTAAFQAAINAADTVLVPNTANGYRIQNTLLVHKPTKIKGDHKTKLFGNESLFYIQSNDVTISDFEIDMDGSPAQSAAFYLNTDNGSIERIYLNSLMVSGAHHAVLDANFIPQPLLDAEGEIRTRQVLDPVTKQPMVDENGDFITEPVLEPDQFIVNLHINDFATERGKNTQILLRDARAYIELHYVAINSFNTPDSGIPNFYGISVAGAEGITLKDVHITSPRTKGYIFEDSAAIWIARSSADTTADIGYRFINVDGVYISDSVASHNLIGGAEFVNSRNIQLSNFVANGRANNGADFEAAPSSHGVNFVNSFFIQTSNLSVRNNTGWGLIINGCSDSIFNGVLAIGNGGAVLPANGNTNVSVNGNSL